MHPIELLWRTAGDMWRDCPRWKWSVVGAGVLTVWCLFNGAARLSNAPLSTGAGGLPQNPPQVPQPAFPSATQPPMPVPAPGAIQPSAPVDQQAAGRLDAFFREAHQAETTIQAAGERCEHIAEAAKSLKPSDPHQAMPAQKDMLNKARDCEQKLKDSNSHWNAAAAAGVAAQGEPTLAAANRYVAAIKALDTFDLSRSEPVRQQWIERSKKLQDALASFQQEMNALGPLAALYRPQDPASLKVTEELAAARQRITGLGVKPGADELNPDQRRALDVTGQALAEIEKSDEKLAALNAAWTRRDEDPAAVLLVLAAMTELDRARWNIRTDRPATLAAMESQAAQDCPAVLGRLLATYERAKTRTTAEQIVGLRRMGERFHAVLPIDVIAATDRVTTDLADSHHRLEKLLAAATSWRELRQRGARARDPVVEKQVLDALAAVVISGHAQPQPFDADGMGPDHKQAFAEVLAASIEISGRLPAGNRGAVALFIDARALSGDPLVEPLADLLSNSLRGSGFGIANRPDTAALVLTVANPALRDLQTDDETGDYKRQLSVSARLVWGYSGRTVDLGQVQAVGQKPERGEAVTAALNATANSLARRVLKALQES